MLLTISTHTPARGVTTFFRITGSRISDFNPHSREGSDFRCASLCKFLVISTHTPARGVTPAWDFLLVQLIFQPTLPQGE